MNILNSYELPWGNFLKVCINSIDGANGIRMKILRGDFKKKYRENKRFAMEFLRILKKLKFFR